MLLTTKLVVKESKGGRGLFATDPIAAGEELIRFTGKVIPTPSRYTLQFGEDQHLLWPQGLPEDLINHACEPSCYLDFANRTLVAATAIAAGEEITLNYLASEWEMASPFPCSCGSSRCLQVIRGYRFLTEEERQRVEPWTGDFLKRLAASDAALPAA